jgi:hypothetical protein
MIKEATHSKPQAFETTPTVTNDSKGEVIGPFEYKVADAIAKAYEKHELEQQYQGTYDTWPREVDRAASELEEALLDSGVLDSLLQLVDAIGEKLHNGEYVSGIEREESIPPDPYGVADRHSTGGYDFYEPEDSGNV